MTKSSLPLAFYFNTEGAILGELVFHLHDNDANVQYHWFRATKLLPCGPHDAGIQKFTGNDNAGNIPAKDDFLTMAIHAFAHYSVLYSKNTLLLCNLQGTALVQYCLKHCSFVE